MSWICSNCKSKNIYLNDTCNKCGNQKENTMNIDDLYDDIEELEDENNPDNEELI